MSNRVDYTHTDDFSSAISAGQVCVMVDGRQCSYLEVKEISQGCYPDFSWARISYNPFLSRNAMEPDFAMVFDTVKMGKSLSVHVVYNSSVLEVTPQKVLIFEGFIERIRKSRNSSGENFEITAKDISSKLGRVVISGRRIESGEDTLFFESMDTVFNKDSVGNRSDSSFEHNGKSYKVFSGEDEGFCWTCAEAIIYLLSEYVNHDQLQLPDIEQLNILTSGAQVIDMDVTGLDILSGLNKLCEGAGLKYKFEANSSDVGPRYSIKFFRQGDCRAVELNCQKDGERFDISRSDILSFSSDENYWPVTHRYVCQGDYKVFESSFELVKGWDSSLESTEYDKYSIKTNSDFNEVRNVFRKWCLNEAGDYSLEPYDRGDAFDLSKIFGTEKYTRSKRRFWPALSCDVNGNSMGYYLEVSYDDGSNWQQYPYAFNNLLDECGVWLSSESLDVNLWVAAYKDVLKFRITASIISDERIRYEICDGPIDSVAAVFDKIITLPKNFQYKKVTTNSVFYPSVKKSLLASNEVDDIEKLVGYLRSHVENTSNVIETIKAVTPVLRLGYSPGDRVISGIESSNWLSEKYDERSLYWLDSVKVNFQKQQTELVIKRQRRRYYHG